MNVLSLFNGMSCGEIALRQVGIIPEIYYSSEIDKHAIAQTQLNFPNTIQLGSVVDINVNDLQPIDLLIGGSPCQSFSFAGKRKGMVTKCEIQITKLEQYLELKESGFEFEGQSYLFWEYMRILTDIRKYSPDVKFLLENVEMGSKWERILSEAIGIYGVHINSALVPAQNRKRIYWTNIQTKEVGLFGELHANIP
jgi:DNA (cytosine-5)-methyltransferase 3A